MNDAETSGMQEPADLAAECHRLRIKACTRWSGVAKGYVDVAACEAAQKAEKELREAIDRLASLASRPQPQATDHLAGQDKWDARGAATDIVMHIEQVDEMRDDYSRRKPLAWAAARAALALQPVQQEPDEWRQFVFEVINDHVTVGYLQVSSETRERCLELSTGDRAKYRTPLESLAKLALASPAATPGEKR